MTEFGYDSVIAVTPLIRRVVAQNPSAMTLSGTNSYLIGSRDVIAIDPGPDLAAHVDALVAAGGDRLRYIVLTHGHEDHAPAAAALSERTGAVVLGGGVREQFTPRGILSDGDCLRVPGISLRVIATPGHSSDHCCFLVDASIDDASLGMMFSGDHVLNGTTTAVVPPDGNMRAYLESVQRCLDLGTQITAIAPGHGDIIRDPRAVLLGYLSHRLEREAQILRVLEDIGDTTANALVTVIYGELEPRVRRAASATLWAHLQKLAVDGRVTTKDVDDQGSIWTLA